MTRFVGESWAIMDWTDRFTREWMIELMDAEIERLPEDQRASARFKVDDGALYIVWLRPETAEEKETREAQDVESKRQEYERRRAEYEQLKKQFEGE